MGLPSLPLLLAAALVVFVAWALYRVASPPARRGPVLAVDSGSAAASSGGNVAAARRMTSYRYGVTGTPDELRTTASGEVVPVEIKSARGPPPGEPPYPSHRLQLLAYCLLVEEEEGLAPPYGLLVYQDGTPRPVPWDAVAREELLWWLDRVRMPYSGEASPSPEKCRRCTYRTDCDAALVSR